MSKGRIRIRVGDVVAIPLGEDDLIAFAVILPDANFAIFDARGNLTPEEALQHAPLFYVAVMDSAVKSGQWPVMKVAKDKVLRSRHRQRLRRIMSIRIKSESTATEQSFHRPLTRWLDWSGQPYGAPSMLRTESATSISVERTSGWSRYALSPDVQANKRRN